MIEMHALNMKRNAIVVAAVAFLMLFGAAQAGALDTLSYGVNARGQTYGPAINPVTKQPNAIEPDLRAVQASNGERGYVYTSELNGVLNRLRSMSDEEYRALRDEQAQELVEASEQVLGIKALSEQGAAEYLTNIKIAESMKDAEASACSEMSSAINAEVSRDPSMASTVAALNESGIVEVQDVSIAAESGADYFAVKDSDRSQLGVNGEIAVPESTMYEIANIAREATAIQLTVYKSDGETAVGTMPFNLM